MLSKIHLANITKGYTRRSAQLTLGDRPYNSSHQLAGSEGNVSQTLEGSLPTSGHLPVYNHCHPNMRHNHTSNRKATHY
jgi:hypothetical protein